MQEKIVITEQNIEEMCRLAEDVMQVLYMEYFFYDEEGNERLLSELEKEKREAIYNATQTKPRYRIHDKQYSIMNHSNFRFIDFRF